MRNSKVNGEMLADLFGVISSIKDEKECEAAVQTMARMHKGMIFSETEWDQIPVPYSLKKEFSKRNAELRRLRRYLKEKRQNPVRFLWKCIVLMILVIKILLFMGII